MALQSLARIGNAEEPKPIPVSAQSSLAAYIRGKYEVAKTAKQPVIERLLRCERQRKGEYDPEMLAKIKQTGGSEVYMMLTDIKCRAAESWIKDVMMSAGEAPFAFEPTKEPQVPMEMHDAILNEITMQVMQAQQQGMQVTPEMVEGAVADMHKEVAKAIRQAAKQAADAMGVRVMDILQEAKFERVLSDIIYDFVTFPACIVKGPVIHHRQAMAWGNNWTPVVTTEKGIHVERVSPYDAFPSPSATDCHDGDFIERHRFFRQDLAAMLGTPGYKDSELKLAIERYGKSGLREVTYGETEREWLAGRRTSLLSGEIIEGLEYWGGASGSMLLEWGMKGVDPHTEYQITALLIGEHVVRAVINPDPLGRRPYSKASFKNMPGAFWGSCPPEMMRDVQTMCNSSARALANNMGVASGPQVEVTVDRLPDGENVTQVFPWKVWQTTSDRTGGGQPAIRFFQPNMNAEVLLNVLQYFMRVADEITGIPNYIYGSNAVGGAGRTASGLSMLMENASKGIKQAILDLDYAINDVLERIYYHLMVYDQDHAIKGDMKIVPAGVVGALIKDHVNEKRVQLLQTTANPVDMQIIGVEGRAELLRQVAVGMQLETDGIIPDAEALQSKLAQAQQQQVPPEVMAMQEELQQLRMQVQNKEQELALKRDEIRARSEDAKRQANALIESRMHDSEVKAQHDREAKIESAKIADQTARYVADLKAEVDREREAARREIERERLQRDSDVQRATMSSKSEQAQQSNEEVKRFYADIAKALANQPAPVVNVQVDANTGDVKAPSRAKAKRAPDNTDRAAE